MTLNPFILVSEWRLPNDLSIWLNVKVLLLAINFPLSMLNNSNWNFLLLSEFFLVVNWEEEKVIINLLMLSSKLSEWYIVFDSVKSLRLSSIIPSYISYTPLSVTSEKTILTYEVKSNLYLFNIIWRNFARVVLDFNSVSILNLHVVKLV